jgi:outer membrane immunogenic protein
MRRSILALAGILLSAVSAVPLAANAADLRLRDPLVTKASVPMTDTWSGFYVGMNAGMLMDSNRFTTPISGDTLHNIAGMAGASMGYNFQSGAFVFGIEGDADFANTNGGIACVTGLTTCSVSNSWAMNARVRAGLTTPALLPFLTAWTRTGAATGLRDPLIYVTGGMAMRDVSVTTAVGSAATDRTGWTLGAGIEIPINAAVSMATEYQFADFGRMNCGVGCGLKLDEHKMLARLNVRFTGF